MDRLICSQRAFAVKSFYKNGNNAIAAQREFRFHYNLGRRARVPTCRAINTWVENFELNEPQKTLKHFEP